MKAKPFFTFLKKMMLIFTIIYLTSCQKEILQNAVDNSATISKVNSWLESEKGSKYVFGTSVDNIKINLDFDKLHLEKLGETEKLMIIPLKASFISEVNKGKNPLNFFLLIQNKEGNIRKGNIVQFIAKEGKKINELPENTFYNFYNKYWLVCDGSFTFLNINDKILYQMDYANGKLAAYAEKISKVADNPNKFSSGPSDQFFDTCIEWYWLTFANGVLINEQYLYTECGINVEEGGGGGGSGSGGGWPGIELGYPDQWWLDETWIKANIRFGKTTEPTPEELLLIILHPVEALLINKNATSAQNETVSRFGVNGLNNASDAFRHAFWLALNTKSVGLVLALQFSNAHETQVPPQFQLEKDMDLHNNWVGISLYQPGLTDTQLAQRITDGMQNGLGMYLSPINYNDPCYWTCAGNTTGTHGITTQTHLTPTP